MILALMVLLAGDPLVRTPDVYIDPVGWSVASVQPVTDLIRWNKFENAINNCPICMDQAASRGLFKTFRRIYMDGPHHWQAFALDIPQDMGLIFEEEASLWAISDGDTLISEYLLFPVGWNPVPQHAERLTPLGPVYVKPAPFGNGPSSEDYEWVRFRSEWDNLPKYYVLGYARFGHPPKGDAKWSVTGVTPYRR
jgi:hypothetical protein